MSPAAESAFKDHFSGQLGGLRRDLPFPFAELPAPALAMTADWRLDQLMGYFATWSAVKAYRRTLGRDPLPALREQLADVWLASGVSLATAKNIKWPLSLRFGRL